MTMAVLLKKHGRMKFLNEISGWEMNGKCQEENMDEKQRLEELKKTLE